MIPLYAQLKEAIISSIANGEVGPDDRLPSQRELCEQHNMSLLTVRRAIDELLNEGIIYAIPGKGLYVVPPKEEAETGPLISFTEEMARRGMVASSQLLSAEIVGASTILARTLDVSIGSRLVYLRRLRLAENELIAVQTSYLVEALCPGILKDDLENGSLYATLRNTYGLSLTDSSVTVEAALSDDETANLLGLPSPAALLITEQITLIDSGRPIEFTRTLYRADRYRVRVH